MPKTVVYHIEDEEDWQEIVEDSVNYHSQNFEYTSDKGPINDAIDRLSQRHGLDPLILLVDLRLNQPASEFRTLHWLTSSSTKSLRRNLEIVILSGHLPDGAKHWLQVSGIPKDQILEKGTYDGLDLVQTLEKVEARLLQDPVKHSDKNDEPEICRLTVRIKESEDHDGIVDVKSGQLYHLDVQITSISNITQYDSLVGQKIVLYAFCRKASISPSRKTITVPPPNSQNRESFGVKFDEITGEGARTVIVCFYHENHLMRLLELPVRVR